MKKIFLLLIISLLFNSNILCQEGWFWQNPLPQGNNLFGVYFIDNNIGYAVGDNGTIIRTSDGGENWFALSSGTVNDLEDVYFFDSQNGFVVGGTLFSGIILKTTNGGTSWVSDSIQLNYGFYSIHFTDINTGTVVGHEGAILRTTDSGESWVNQVSGITGDHSRLNDVYFKDSNNGIVVGDSGVGLVGIILKTTDGGNTWLRKLTISNIRLYSVSFTNSNIGTAVGPGVILRTTDFGETWVTQTISFNYILQDIQYCDLLNGIIVGYIYDGSDYLNLILTTTDSGENWVPQSIGESLRTWAVSFPTLNCGIAVGDLGTIMKSSSSGSNWSNLSNHITTIDLQDVCFANELYGIAVGREGIILRTTNGGQNWYISESGTNEWLAGVSMPSTNIATVVGRNGIILRTSNGGESWVNLLVDSMIQLTDVCFTDENTGTIVGSGGKIIRTTDGGETWIPQNSGTNQGLLSLSFYNKNIGMVVGNNGTILRTSNGGINWINQSWGVNVNLRGVTITDSNNAFVIGQTILYKTTDGGQSWQLRGFDNCLLRSVHFTSGNVGTIVGQWIGWGQCCNGIILHTTNGGLTWILQSLGPSIDLTSVMFVDSLVGAVVGRYGTILHTTDGGGGGPVDVHDIQINSIPSEYSLFQNYPNPFNPATTIAYQIPEREFVTLKVYDILGREVATLVNEEKPAGSYEAQFTGNGLTSGIYFYQLTAGNYTETKKMILLR